MKSDLVAKIADIAKKVEQLDGRGCCSSSSSEPLEYLKACLKDLQVVEEELHRQSKDLETARRSLKAGAIFELMIALSPDCLFRQDRELRYTWFSKENIFGLASTELIGKTDLEIFPPQEAEKIVEIKQKVMETEKGTRTEARLIINGVERYFDAFYEPWRDETGRITGIAGYARDITERKKAEVEIRKMTAVVETAPTAIVLIDLDGMIEYTNPRLLEMGGFKEAQEILGRSVFEFTDDEGKETLQEEIIPVLCSEGYWRGELPLQLSDGSTFVAEMICSQVRGDLGKPNYFSANFFNITERKMAEEALLLDESRMEALLKLNQMDESSLQKITDFALEAGVKLTNSKLGYLAFVDDEEKSLIMHSWSQKAMTECRAHRQIIYPLETTGLWGEAVRQRQAVITNDYSSSPLRKGLPDGHVEVNRHMNVPIIDRGKVVVVAGVGNKDAGYDESDVRQLTLLMSGMWRIIQRREAEEALKESQRTLATLMKNLPGMAYRCRNDREWTMEFVSEGCLDLTGYRPSELMHNAAISFGQLVHPDDRVYVWNEVQEALAERRPFRLIYRIRSLLGTKWVWEQGQGIFSPDGDLLFLEGFINDITERKLAEEALRRAHDELEKRVEERTAWLLRANDALHEEMAEHKKTETRLRRAQQAADAASKAKSDFLANMSHEIRTPMNAVIGLAGLLLDTNLTPVQKDYVQTIRSSGDALLAVINDILDFSKIDQGKMDIERQPFGLEECIESSMAMVEAIAAEKGLDISYAIDENAPCALMGDEARLRQVLVNLLSNAVKFTDKGLVRISVDLLDKGCIHFAVRDTGMGISEDSIAKLFQSFSQVDTSACRKHGGTGLGLAISRRLVELMGGKI